MNFLWLISQLVKKTKVSKEFLQLAKVARDYSSNTNGIFNPFILPNLQSAGYLGSWPDNTSRSVDSLDFRYRDLVSSGCLELGSNWVRIPAGSALDFGGIGKGYLLDELSDYLHQKGELNFWISLGGDIICSGFNINQKPWQVSIADAKDKDERAEIDTIELAGFGQFCAVATSGVIKRKGADWHHLIDPRTGEPSSSFVLTASVTARSAVEADIMAKCLQIMGSNSATELVKGYNLGYLLQLDTKKKFKIEKYNWN